MSRGLPLVRLPPFATIHRFGSLATEPPSSALLRFPAQGWEIPRFSAKPPGWAIVGDAEGRRLAVETLLSRHRIHPISPPPGPFPYITSLLTQTSSASASTASSSTAGSASLTKPIRHLAFARPPITGEFTDFTARYGALHEEDKLSFRQTLLSLQPTPSPDDIERVSRTMAINHLLDLPTVSLSSGQTRRARIASALLTQPVLLLLEDPLAGLDVRSREEVSRVLGELNKAGDIRIVLVLRGKGIAGMPEWVTDVYEVRNGDVWLGSKLDWTVRTRGGDIAPSDENEQESRGEKERSEPLVELRDVSVSYGEGSRPVLRNVSWIIRPGERWHLQGANGSGKTSLLSLILGHHPRSFSLPSTSLILFSKPRRLIPTPKLRTLIGHISPEIYASFPRGIGLSAMESVGSGFEGIFSRRNLSSEQKERFLYLLGFFKSHLVSSRSPGQPSSVTGSVEDIAKRLFAHFTPPQQALLLFLRAIVNRPPLLILDEPSQGVDEVIWARCRDLLEKEWKENPGQAVIVVSHYEDEVPWRAGRGRILKLVDGIASIDQ